MSATLAALGLSAVSSLIGAAANNQSVQQTNGMNYKMFRQQLDFDKWKFGQEQQFNSLQNNPAYRAQLLRAAGINPSLAGLSNAGSASVSAGGSPTPTPMQPTDFSGLASDLSTSYSTYMLSDAQRQSLISGSNLNNENAAGMAIDNSWKNTNNAMAFANSVGDYKLKKQAFDLGVHQIKSAQLQNEFNERSMGDRLMQQSWQTELVRSQAEAQLLTNKYIEPQAQAAVKQVISQAFANYATGKATLQQAHTDMMRMYAQFGANDEQRGQFFKATLDALVQSRKTAQSSEYVNWLSPGIQAGINGYGFGANAKLPYPNGMRHGKMVADDYDKKR